MQEFSAMIPSYMSSSLSNNSLRKKIVILSTHTRHLWCVCVFVLFNINILFSQNLIPNSGFENRNSCSTLFLNSDTSFTSYGSGWWSPTNGSPLHYTSCNKHVNGTYYHPGIWWDTPKNGDGFVTLGLSINKAFSTDSRTYIQTKLKKPLDSGCTYRFKVALKPWGRRRVLPGLVELPIFGQNLGVVLSRTQIHDYSSNYALLLNNPSVIKLSNTLSDTTQYSSIEQSFVADGGEEYLTIGFFSPSDQMHFLNLDGTTDSSCNILYYVDDVFLEKSTPIGFKPAQLNDTSLCPGDSITIETGLPNVNTTWNTGVKKNKITVSKPGHYWFTIDHPCFNYSDTIEVISVPNESFITTSIDTSICQGENLEFDFSEDKFNEYEWSDGTTSPIKRLNTSGNYQVTSTNICGKSSSLEIQLEIVDCSILFFIPNSFTPDEDGVNDIFTGYIRGATEYQFSIYNRWGMTIHSASGTGNKISWNGRFNEQIVPEGTYVIKIYAENLLTTNTYSGMINIIH